MKHKSLLARAAAAAATLGVAVAGAVVISSPQANAALKETKYVFYTYAFGTGANVDIAGLNSGPLANSFIGCTRYAGKVRENKVSSLNLPGSLAGLGAVTSESRTFKRANGEVGTVSKNTVANVRVGAPNTPNLVIKGLETLSEAYVDKNGKFHTRTSFTLADITANTGVPAVDDLLNKAGVGIGDLFKVIKLSENGTLAIPGVGQIMLGHKGSAIGKDTARSEGTALRVRVFGADGKLGGSDDINLVVGRSYARVQKNVPVAVMGGRAYAAEAKVLGDLVGVGYLAMQPLPCPGTNGKVVTNSTAGAPNLAKLGLLDIGVSSGSVYGVQNKNGTAKAWTQGKVAGVGLGTPGTSSYLEIKGIVGRATLTKSASGKITKSKAGTKLASITVGGKEYDINLGDKIEIPGVAVIRFGVVENKNKRSMKVTAVQIKVLEKLQADTGVATINLGVAETRLKRY